MSHNPVVCQVLVCDDIRESVTTGELVNPISIGIQLDYSTVQI